MAQKRGPPPTDKTEEIRRILQENNRPFMGTGELADAMGYKSNPGVKKHLDRAEEEGELVSASISGYKIWYLPELTEPIEPNVEPSDQQETHVSPSTSDTRGDPEFMNSDGTDYSRMNVIQSSRLAGGAVITFAIAMYLVLKAGSAMVGAVAAVSAALTPFAPPMFAVGLTLLLFSFVYERVESKHSDPQEPGELTAGQ